MNKIVRLLFWITTIISLTIIYTFYPQGDVELFPLFMDLTIFLLFLPAYFYVCWGLLPFACLRFFKNKQINSLLIATICLVAFVNSLAYLSFYAIEIRLLLNVLAMLPTFLFWLIVLNLKAYFKNKLQNVQ